jgi:hypothetical protein
MLDLKGIVYTVYYTDTLRPQEPTIVRLRDGKSAGETRGRTPARVVVVGRDISVLSRPIASSVSELLVAFMLPKSYELFSQGSSKPPATITITLPVRIASEVTPMGYGAVALHAFFRNFYSPENFGCSPSANRNLDWPA